MCLARNWSFALFLFIGSIFNFGNSKAQIPWYKTTTVYQIYPRSFYDSNGDGIGDLRGILSKLDYLKNLGVETIWISPFFASPQADFGYDISDFKRIAPEYGSMEDCELLILEVHKKGLRIVFDLVMNHTSDQHPWFLESASSENNPKRDWYIWKKGKKEPTNWKSMTGGSGWHYDKKTDSWFWATFLPFQPDLNYNNPETKAEMLQTARFWLKKGVDGFRLDIFNCLYEDSLFRDNPGSLRMVPSEENTDAFFQKNTYTQNQAGSMQFAQELRQVMNEFTEPKYSVGEVFGKADVINKFCANGQGIHSVFLFKTLHTKFKAKAWGKLILEADSNFKEPLFPTWVLSNHDKKRFISRLANKEEKMRLISALQLTQRGIPFLYYGEEIGMEQQKFPFKAALDPIPKKFGRFANSLARMSGESMNRDECRTPMQWDNTQDAGFSQGGKTWLPIGRDYKKRNVMAFESEPNSLLNHYKNLLKLRKEREILSLGKVETVIWKGKILQITRTWQGKKALLMYNFGKGKKKISLPEGGKVYNLTHTFQKERNRLFPYQAVLWVEESNQPAK
jgi:glycosidase